MNNGCLEKVGLGSRMTIFDFLNPFFLSTCANMEARSYGPGGQRYGLGGAIMTIWSPSFSALSFLTSNSVCAPGFHACGMVDAGASKCPGTEWNLMPMPGAPPSRS